MKVTVNLASQPYVELRPVYNRLRTWIVILLLFGGALWFLYRNERTQAEDASARVTGVAQRVSNLQQMQQKYQTMMQQPKDAAILRQSDFLNSLFRRKAFSWTATMTDLETVLPSGVQVLSLDPIIAADGHVIIHLRVTGARDRALDLIRNLERSRHFAAPRLAAESLATSPTGAQPGMQNVSTGNDVNFEILADYRPLPLPEHPVQKKPAAVPAGKPKAHAEHHRPIKPKAGVPGGKPTP